MSLALRPAQPRQLRAFTLVEMLVVISIIAVLASLILPSILATKGIAHRSSCANNVRNLYVAAQQFEVSKGHLPASRTFWNSPQYRATGSMPASWNASNAPSQTLTWVHELMPYFERQDLREQVEGQLLSKGSVQNVGGRINILVCPSEPLEDLPPANPSVKYARLSYGCNSGVADNTSLANPQYGLDWPQNGLFDNRLKGSTTSLPEAQLKTYETSLGRIPDGTSNTILFVDNPDLEEWNFAPTEFHVCVVWDDQNYPNVRQAFSLSAQAAKGIPSDKPDTLLNLYKQGVNYVLPYARPTSYHPGGFMVAFCDGSVRFVSESIAYEVYMQLMTSEGRKYQPAGMKTLPAPPPPPATTNNAIQNVFQSPLDGSSF
jgi:prepilin-type N-terminal cleavage/methylation domain-containing protein/prepilin-type processing-associated H-X9-DG protein